MTNVLTVIKRTGLCSIQDLGRPQAQHLGFSVSGAADEFSFRYANYLLTNPEDYAALEITMGQISIQANCACTIAITGADCKAKINDLPIKHWAIHQLNAGDELVLLQPQQGLHTYIAVYGGLNERMFSSSQSQTMNEMHLGILTTAIENGSSIKLAKKCLLAMPLNTSPLTNPYIQSFNPLNFHQSGELVLRFMPSKLFQSLALDEQQRFIGQEFHILADSNRMGYRLAPVNEISGSDLAQEQVSEQKIFSQTIQPVNQLSQPVCFGGIQYPANDQLIVLMKERQTMGGYPILGNVTQTDLFRLSQKRSGEQVRFIPISLAQAQQQLLNFYQKFNR